MPVSRNSNAFKDNVGGGPSDLKSTPGNAVEAGEVDTRLACASVAGGAATSREEQVLPPDIHADKEAPATTELTPAFDKSGRYAYVVALWGSAAGFALGALVLGAALRRSGTRYDLVLLYTEDVPASTIDLLSRVWITREVRYLEGHGNLYTCKGYRFDGVFTKLHVLSLVEYEKVLMLDIDLAVIACPDAIFDLRPPAAMCRGQTAARWSHGSWIDGRRFFAEEKWPLTPVYFTEQRWPRRDAGITIDDCRFLGDLIPPPKWWSRGWGRG